MGRTANNPDRLKEIEEAFEWNEPFDVILALVHFSYDRMGDLQWEELPRGLRIALLVNEFDSQVANGGFQQYFFNSSGEYALETLGILQAVGARETAQLLEQALTVFPNSEPSQDNAQRADQVARLNDDQLKKLESLSQAYYQQNENLFEVTASYLGEHKSELVPVA